MNQAIIIIGGYNSLWPTYLRMARDLEDITGLQAIGVPLMPWHWLASRQQQEASNILQKLEETVVWARRRFRADRFVLVGHSAGGIAARLYLCEQPVWGKVYAGVEHVTAVISLGTPHCGDKGADTGWFLTDEANQLVPGSPYVGRVRYRAVAGRSVQGHQQGDYRERRAFRAYHYFAGQGDAWGDGIVPVECAALHGAEELILEGVVHARKHGRAWYGGSKAIIRHWWPQGVGHAD